MIMHVHVCLKSMFTLDFLCLHYLKCSSAAVGIALSSIVLIQYYYSTTKSSLWYEQMVSYTCNVLNLLRN